MHENGIRLIIIFEKLGKIKYAIDKLVGYLFRRQTCKLTIRHEDTTCYAVVNKSSKQ
jgi:hypothetical protein